METPPQLNGPSTGGRTLFIGRWRIDPAADEIASAGRVVKLEPLQMRLLLTLAQHAGQVVTTQTLLDRVWGELVVTQNSVYQAVAQLRRQLGSGGDEAGYIQTVHRKGYRLLAPVQQVDVASAAPAATAGAGGGASEAPRLASTAPAAEAIPEPNPDAPPAQTKSGTAGRRLLLLGGAALAAAGIGTAAWVALAPPRRAAAVPRLAVLPFADRSPGATEEALSRGLALDVIQVLGQRSDVQVVAAESVRDLQADSDERAADIARRLDVQYLLLGTVSRSGSALQLTVRLLMLPQGRSLWQHDFRSAMDAASELPATVARQAAAALGLAGPAPSASASAASPTEAYELYVLGNNAWQPRTPEAFAKAREYFQRGINLDPAYARNYIGLGWTWIGQATNAVGVDLPRAIALATPLFDRALRLQPDSAEALTAQATLHTFAAEYDAARTLLGRALQASPNYVQAHHSLGVAEFDSGWPQRAAVHFQRAAQLNPLSAAPLDRLALAQLFGGQPAAAAATAQRAVSLHPQHPNGYWSLGIAGYAAGDLAQAVRGYRQALEREPRRPYLWHELGWLYLDLELPDQAASAFARTVEQLPREAWPAVRATLPWLVRGDRSNVPPALQRMPEDVHAIELSMFRALAGLPLDAAALKRALDAAAARGEFLIVEPWFLFQGHNRLVNLATVEVLLGQRGAADQHLATARDQLDKLERQGNRWHAMHFHRARLLALGGQGRPALDALAAAVSAGSRRGWWLDLDPAFAAVRAEPRFVALRAQISGHLQRQRQQLGF